MEGDEIEIHSAMEDYPHTQQDLLNVEKLEPKYNSAYEDSDSGYEPENSNSNNDGK